MWLIACKLDKDSFAQNCGMVDWFIYEKQGTATTYVPYARSSQENDALGRLVILVTVPCYFAYKIADRYARSRCKPIATLQYDLTLPLKEYDCYRALFDLRKIVSSARAWFVFAFALDFLYLSTLWMKSSTTQTF